MAKKKSPNEKYIFQLVANNIRRFRSLHNISQLALAENIGLTHNFINDIENCKKGVSYKTLAKLSKFFDVEPFQFFLPDGMPNNIARGYVKDFYDAFQKVANDLSQHYFTGKRK